ncbi:MAG: anthranilate synthase component I [Candidatus Omnitrophica bacterium]|nr:anthranilate synthase component I [Candidatus Omnitrophota bacterium]MDD5661964.1 anthranilate synthase component I [Candidatus Omnitrophota bacterium]
MIHPPLKEFIRLTRKGNVIPVYKEINADLETPVSAFLKVAKGDYAFLLESVEGQEKIARFSFLGASPSLVFKSKGRRIEISEPAKKGVKKFITRTNPIDEVKKIMRDFKAVAVKGLPRFCGGLVGFIGYDTVRFFEGLPDKNPDDLKTPDTLLMLADTLLVFDHVNHNIKIVSNVILPKGKLSPPKIKAFYNKARKRIGKIQADFNRQLNENEVFGPAQKIKFSSNFKKSEFEDAVRQAKRYIKKGDIIQVVPSQRFKVITAKDPFMVYRKLRSLNPSPYMYFLRLKDMYLVGASPEMLVRCEDGLIQTRPIAGTRPRGKNEEEDVRLARELINDKKERSEHLMLVDLGRNDLGRVSSTGTVEVTEFMNVEKYSHVMHLVSEVKGKLDNKRYDIYDVLKAAFPAGTVSGSPKIRAMEIIDELENSRRGPYAGCVGYFSFSHNMDTCINIRTILIKGKFAYIQAGGGVVADSVPEKEYFETVNKAKALMEAILK